MLKKAYNPIFRMIKVAFLLLIFISCSNLSNSFVKTGEFSLKGGKFENKFWNDELQFSRHSWFHELSLYFDFLISPIDQSSPFYSWVQSSGREEVTKVFEGCSKKYIAIVYHYDPQIFSETQLKSQLNEQGFKKISLSFFQKQFRMHGDHFEMSFHLYKLYGLCLENPIKNLHIIVPGFNKAVIPIS